MSRSKKNDNLSSLNIFPFCEGIYPTIFHNNPAPQWLFDSNDKKIIDVNEAWEKFTGYTKKEVVGHSLEALDLFSFNGEDAITEELTEKQLLKYQELEVKTKAGEVTYGLATFQSIEFEKDTYIISTILDISDLKKVQNELCVANNFSDRLLNSMTEAIVVLDINFCCVKVNNAYCKMTGFEEKDIVGTKVPFPHWAPEHYDTIKDYIQRGLKEGFSREQLTMVKANGDRFEVAIASTKITDHNNKTIGYFSTAVDISERLRYQKELQEKSKKSVERKDAILNLMGLIGRDFNATLEKVMSISAKVMEVKRVSIWQFNKDESAIHCLNAYHLDTNNYENDKPIYTEDYPNYFKTLYNKSTIRVDRAWDSNLSEEFVNEYLKPAGISSLLDAFIKGTDSLFGVICFEHIGSPRKWTDEEEEFATMIASIVSLAVENSERKKIENKLLIEKEFSDELVGSLVEGLSVVSLEKKIIRVNKALCEMTGFTEQELLGDKLPFKYWPPECYEEIVHAFSDTYIATSNVRELTLMRKNGERFPVALAFSTIKDKNGDTKAYFATISDITNRINEEEALKHRIQISQKRKEIISELVGMMGQDYDATIKHIVRLSSEALNANYVRVWKFKDDGNQLASKVFYDAKKGILVKEDLTLNRSDFPEYFGVFDTKSVLKNCDIDMHPTKERYAKIAHSPEQKASCVDAVIYGKSMNYGLLSFESHGKKHLFTDEEENFAASVATIISLMIESKERMAAETQLINTNEKLQAVNIELKALKKELERENSYLREEIGLVFNYEEMVYGSKAFSQVLTDVESVAATNATVLLLGESGTGKELLARAIHNISARKNKPLIKVNCAAIPRELIESELFGHKKGAFTGAISDKLGKFQLADGGTLFLDEIGELPLEMQPKLLRAIQESEIEQVGGTKTQKVDIRIIAATNRDLEKAIKEKSFREDLYFRINVFPITVPPLRERIEDIPILIEHFVNKYTKLYNKKITYISDATKSNLQSYNWPGNVRELENLVERAVILSNDEKLVIPNFKSSSKESLISSTVLSLEDVQRIHIKKVLTECHWKIDGEEGAAELLQMKPSTLRDRMKKLGLEKP
ncbi:PAS domain S-box-containing protein [Gelidibacter algens]|uniref:PAS domain S-box-containing protein n=1 Tax=Gelidibacter algens TaxID=49280 RepID=A0A1A7QZM7_9FLAO|nr:sigma 54-interacting transcriptional regulator [Gelidibacter algens]OBX24728.1 hypothetical protein A9996_13590 [Gelidibacter algens]RAJ19299.1 PAS domain S-box-containing protein [Gelidibacter algens]